jgi:hypothetical protein
VSSELNEAEQTAMTFHVFWHCFVGTYDTGWNIDLDWVAEGHGSLL